MFGVFVFFALSFSTPHKNLPKVEHPYAMSEVIIFCNQNADRLATRHWLFPTNRHPPWSPAVVPTLAPVQASLVDRRSQTSIGQSCPLKSCPKIGERHLSFYAEAHVPNVAETHQSPLPQNRADTQSTIFPTKHPNTFFLLSPSVRNGSPCKSFQEKPTNMFSATTI